MTHLLSKFSMQNGAGGPGSKGWVRIFPIVFFFCYLNFTVLLFSIGPWEFPVDSELRLYTFLGLAHCALLLGYLSAASSKPAGYSRQWRLSSLVKYSVLINLLLLIPTSRFRTGSSIPNVVAGIVDPGDAYARSLMLREDSEPLIEYVRIFLGPVLFMALPFTVFYWRKLSLRNRIGGVLSLLGTVALFIAMGTNKAIADSVLMVPTLLFASYGAGRIRLSRRQIIGVAVASLLTIVLFLGYFGFAVSSRDGSVVSAGYFAATHTHVDEDNFLLRYLPPPVANALIGLDLYLTHGYYAVSLSLQEPFVPMFGVGNSTFLQRQAARMTGNDAILDLPYPVRIEKYGWDAELLWSTIYPWLASDVSFPGTLIVVFLIGRLFALSWLDTLRGENPFAVLMFSLLVIMLFYFPANNQVLQSGEGFTSFWGTLILWRWTRRGAKVPSKAPYPRQSPSTA